MYMVTGSPLEGRMLARVKAFLSACGLDWDEAISFTAVLMEDEEIAAVGSLDGGTIKCVAVSPAHQGEDLTARILTALSTLLCVKTKTLTGDIRPKTERFFPLKQNSRKPSGSLFCAAEKTYSVYTFPAVRISRQNESRLYLQT